jgi:GNAT superfamily N-acetyltransferase
MQLMRHSTFAQAASGAGASALNRVFERYLVPITFSSEQLHLHIAYNDVDPSASPIWYDENGNVLAAALLAFRGKRAWIGGFGVAPEFRSRGYGHQLLDALIGTARERGVKSIQLEVLADNLPAIQAYRKAGFERSRVLRSFEHFVEDPSKPAGFITAAIEDFINVPDPATPCWQRERSTLRKWRRFGGHYRYARQLRAISFQRPRRASAQSGRKRRRTPRHARALGCRRARSAEHLDFERAQREPYFAVRSRGRLERTIYPVRNDLKDLILFTFIRATSDTE